MYSVQPRVGVVRMDGGGSIGEGRLLASWKREKLYDGFALRP